MQCLYNHVQIMYHRISILHSTCETKWGQNNMGLVDIVHVAYGASLKKGAHRRSRPASNFLWVVMHTY